MSIILTRPSVFFKHPARINPEKEAGWCKYPVLWLWLAKRSAGVSPDWLKSRQGRRVTGLWFVGAHSLIQCCCVLCVQQPPITALRRSSLILQHRPFEKTSRFFTANMHVIKRGNVTDLNVHFLSIKSRRTKLLSERCAVSEIS